MLDSADASERRAPKSASSADAACTSFKQGQDGERVREDADAPPALVPYRGGGPVAFERVVPASGNLGVAGKQFWLGPVRAGQTVTFWADHELIHLLIGGARVKTVRSHLTSDRAACRCGRDESGRCLAWRPWQTPP